MKDRRPYKIAVKDFETGLTIPMVHICFRRVWEAIEWISNSNAALRQSGCKRWQFIYQYWA